MGINLIVTFTMQLARLVVKEEQKFMVTNSTLHHHSIQVPANELIVLLLITGITIHT